MPDPEPRLLILETSGPPGWVALAEGDRLLAEQSLDETRRHARDLAPAVAGLLAHAGWKPGDIRAVLVSRGPGSYTGLRVGIMSAKAFAYATRCAVVGVDTMAVIARQAPAEVEALDVVVDAQQQKVYVQRFARGGSGQPLAAVDALTIRPVDDWLADRPADVWASGPGLRSYANRLPAGGRIVPTELWQPRPAGMLPPGLARVRAGASDDLWALEPLYLRPSSAEEKWVQRQRGG